MRSGTIAFLAGIVLCQQLSVLPSSAWCWLLLISIPAALYLKAYLHLLMWLVSGGLWALLHAHATLAMALPAELEGRDVLIRGHVISLPVQHDRYVSFTFEPDSLEYQQQAYPHPGKLKLKWYGKYPDLNGGDYWQLQVRLKQPHGFLNPGGFDYEAWLFQQGIRATGYVRGAEQNRQLRADWYDKPVLRLRQAIRDRIKSSLPGSTQTGLLLALAIGDRADMTPQQWQYLQRTGTSHLLAISGLHIGLVAGIVFFLVSRIWRFSSRGMLLLPAPKMAAVFACLAAGFYAALAGFSIPTQRALIMILVVMSALIVSRRATSTHTLSMALLGVLLWDPMAVLSAGFWLSFLAVVIILLVLKGRLMPDKKWSQWIRVQWWLGLGLLPLALLFFQQSSLIAPVVNLVAVPYVSLLVVPVVLLAVLSMPVSVVVSDFILSMADVLSGLMHDALMYLGQLDFAFWQTAFVDPLAALFMFLGIAVLLLPTGLPARWLGIYLCLPVLFYSPSRPATGGFWFDLLDVGQGLAAVVRTKNHTLIFDTGPRFSDRFNTGDAVVLPFLRQAGIDKLDMLIISHADNDHIGGSQALLRNLEIEQVLSSVPEKISIPGKAVVQTSTARPVACYDGQSWQWDGVQFRMLNPDAGVPEVSGYKKNDASCVLQIRTASQGLLLTGDIERQAESSLVEKYQAELHSDVLVVPHHGSKTSSTFRFVDTVSPHYVLYPLGYRNRYRFPHPTVVERYTALGAQQWDTASAGRIHIQFDGLEQALPVSAYREEARRYWH